MPLLSTLEALRLLAITTGQLLSLHIFSVHTTFTSWSHTESRKEVYCLPCKLIKFAQKFLINFNKFSDFFNRDFWVVAPFSWTLHIFELISDNVVFKMGHYTLSAKSVLTLQKYICGISCATLSCNLIFVTNSTVLCLWCRLEKLRLINRYYFSIFVLAFQWYIRVFFYYK